MPKKSPAYGSSKMAKEMAKMFGNKAEPVQIRMRASKDVPTFIKKMQAGHEKTAKSRLRFG